VLSTVRVTFELRGYSMDDVRTIIDLALEYPGEAYFIAETIRSSSGRWPASEVCDSDDVGRLTRSVFDAIGIKVIIPRTDYLIRRARVRATTGMLTPQQFEFAATLSTDWTGTLDEMVETATTLRPALAHAR